MTMNLTIDEVKLIDIVQSYNLHKKNIRSREQERKIWSIIAQKYFHTVGNHLETRWNDIKKNYFELRIEKGLSFNIYDGVLDFLNEEMEEMKDFPLEMKVVYVVSTDDVEGGNTDKEGGEIPTLIKEEGHKEDEDPLQSHSISEEYGDNISKKCIESLLDIDCIDIHTQDFFKDVAKYVGQLPVDVQEKLKCTISDLILKEKFGEN